MKPESATVLTAVAEVLKTSVYLLTKVRAIIAAAQSEQIERTTALAFFSLFSAAGFTLAAETEGFFSSGALGADFARGLCSCGTFEKAGFSSGVDAFGSCVFVAAGEAVAGADTVSFSSCVSGAA